MTDIAIKFTDGEVITANNVEVDLSLTGVRIRQSENEWSYVPLVNVKYLDVKEIN